MEEGLFCKAKPVFVPGRADKPDTLAAFRCDFTAEKGETYTLTIAAHTFYRVYVNGAFLGASPAEGGGLRRFLRTYDAV